jgi:hypothetical protein
VKIEKAALQRERNSEIEKENEAMLNTSSFIT